MEGSAMGSDSKIPTPLGLTQQFEHGLHLVIRRSPIPGKLRFDMCFRQFLFQFITQFHGFVLPGIYVLTKHFRTFMMTGLASFFDHCQRALDMMIIIGTNLFLDIRHVAFTAGNTPAGMDSHLSQFKIRMLGFQHRCFTQFMDIIGKTDLIVIVFHSFNRITGIPGKDDFLILHFKIIFRMALGTNKRTHPLVGSIFNGIAFPFQSVDQELARNTQIHTLRIMTIAATDRIDHFRSPVVPFLFIEPIRTHFVYQPWDIQAFTGPAGSRLRTVVRLSRSAGTQTTIKIFNSIHMSPRRQITFCKAITRPQDYHFGPHSQNVFGLITVIQTFESRIRRILPALIFVGIR